MVQKCKHHCHQIRSQVFAIAWCHCDCCTSWPTFSSSKFFNVYISKIVKASENAKAWLLQRLISAIEWHYCKCCIPWPWPLLSRSNIFLFCICYKHICRQQTYPTDLHQLAGPPLWSCFSLTLFGCYPYIIHCSMLIDAMTNYRTITDCSTKSCKKLTFLSFFKTKKIVDCDLCNKFCFAVD